MWKVNSVTRAVKESGVRRKLCQDSITRQLGDILLWIRGSEPLQHLLALDHLFIAQTDLSDELSQAGVAEQQPASGSDAVGFVLKLLWF